MPGSNFSTCRPYLMLSSFPVVGSVPGIYLVGCCQGPTDIPETVAQASGAAAKVCALFAEGSRAAAPQPALMEA